MTHEKKFSDITLSNSLKMRDYSENIKNSLKQGDDFLRNGGNTIISLPNTKTKQ